MKNFMISAFVAATLTAPAFADVASGPAAAIAHFNQDADSQDGRRTLTSADAGATASTRQGNSAAAFAIFNAQADSQDDIRGLNGATRVSGRPNVAEEIFAGIRAANAENE